MTLGGFLSRSALVLFVGWAILLRPTFLGGNTSYIVVSGTSMEPTLIGGDLAILQHADTYSKGDVVAFHVDGGNVIHRIVGGSSQGFETRGDNRKESDFWKPAASDIAGRLWFSVSGGGWWLDFFREPARIAFLTGVLGFLTVVGARPRRRWRARRGGVALGGVTLGASRIAALVATTAVFAVGVWIAIAAFSPQPTASATRVRYEQVGTLDYVVHTKTSVVYPTETVSAGQPVYTRLAKSIEGTFRYALSSAESAQLSGDGGLELLVSAPEGWSRRLELAPATHFDGATATTTFSIDIAQILEMVSAVERETGVQTGTYDLALSPTIRVSGHVGSDAIEAAFSPSYVFKFSRTIIRPPAALEQKDMALADAPAREPSVRLVLASVPQTAARVLGVALVVAGLLGALVLLAGIGLQLRRDPVRAIALRYGGMLVQVADADRGPEARRVRVASMADLARIARRGNGTILHQHTGAGDLYFVQEASAVYEHAIREGEERQA